ncbi:MAG: ABC transporter ATP-binding protein [Thalassovita sp.]
MQDLQEAFDLTYVFIAHDLAVVEHICDRVAVMYRGKIVELASRDELFTAPKHPYTQLLLEAVPTPDPRQRPVRKAPQKSTTITHIPDTGCAFAPRCALATAQCHERAPAKRQVGGAEILCHNV